MDTYTGFIESIQFGCRTFFISARTVIDFFCAPLPVLAMGRFSLARPPSFQSTVFAPIFQESRHDVV
ncbi:hypothetical protein GA0071314_2365 [Halomonas sp. HL-93]|nr:hypothetical protein GA0071314_2365 [Halomonas sp. HL-93]SNY96533.1 hypothetical protein SAMN04488142_1073 [Halomonas sp. hl-4]